MFEGLAAIQKQLYSTVVILISSAKKSDSIPPFYSSVDDVYIQSFSTGSISNHICEDMRWQAARQHQ